MDGRLFRFEDDERLCTLEDMTDDVAFAVRHDDPDGSTVVGFAEWVNDVFTAYDVIDVGLDELVGYWVRDMVDKDPDALYACTGFREVNATGDAVYEDMKTGETLDFAQVAERVKGYVCGGNAYVMCDFSVWADRSLRPYTVMTENLPIGYYVTTWVSYLDICEPETFEKVSGCRRVS